MYLSAEGMLKLLRVQNHDCLNHLQVISGYLQLGRPAEALVCLRQAAEALQTQGKIFRWQYHTSVLLMLQLQLHLAEIGIELRIESETNLEKVPVKEDSFNQLLRFFIDSCSTCNDIKDAKILLRIWEDTANYFFELSSEQEEKQASKTLEFVKAKTDKMGYSLDLFYSSSGKLECKIPKKSSWFVAE